MRVPGSGPVPCDVMMVAEGPGAEEELRGVPFVGRSGQLLDDMISHYLRPLCRDDVYVTNIVKTRCTKPGKGGKIENRSPTPEEIEADRQELLDEIAYVQPKHIFTLGAHAAEWFLGESYSDMEVSHSRVFKVQLCIHCGLRRINSDCSGLSDSACPVAGSGNDKELETTEHEWREYVVLPIYHPAAALRAKEIKARLHYDFEVAEKLLKGKDVPTVPVDQYPNPFYMDVTDPETCMLLMEELLKAPMVAIDTEGWRDRPWSIQWSVKPGEGYIVRVQQGKCLSIVADAFRRYQGTIVAHPILHEFDILAELDIDLTRKKIIDTTILTYLLRLEPQGLKPLARRWAGMEMQSYEEVTGKASERIGRDWLQQTFESVCTDPKLEKQAKLILAMLEKDTPIRKRWKECRAREVLEEELQVIGPMPLATLDDIPLEKAVKYSCRDADATLRIVDPLMRMVRANGVS